MSNEFEAQAALVVHSISGPDWRRFCELGDSARVVEAIASALRSAVKAEREACAKIADAFAQEADQLRTYNSEESIEAATKARAIEEVAAVIRARNDSQNPIEKPDIP